MLEHRRHGVDDSPPARHVETPLEALQHARFCSLDVTIVAIRFEFDAMRVSLGAN